MGIILDVVDNVAIVDSFVMNQLFIDYSFIKIIIIRYTVDGEEEDLKYE